VLGQLLKVGYREGEGGVDEACDGDFVCAGIDVGNGAVVAVVAIFCDEAV
jgi:hypothetical protein